MKHIESSEARDLSERLLFAQLEAGLSLDLDSSFLNQARRSWTMRTTDKESAEAVLHLVNRNSSTLSEFCCSSPNLDEVIPYGRKVTVFPASFVKQINAGLAVQLVRCGAKLFPEVKKIEDHIELNLPPKLLERGRTSVCYDLSPSLNRWLEEEKDNRISIMGKTLRFKSVRELTQARTTATSSDQDLLDQLGELNMETA